MHAGLPYRIVPPRPCRVRTPQGVRDGLVIGEHALSRLVLHRDRNGAVVTWTPSAEVWVLDASDWAPWSTALAANA